MLIQTPAERRALATWLSDHNPEMLEFFALVSKAFGPAKDVEYTGRGEVEASAVCRGAQKCATLERLRKRREEIEGRNSE